MTAGGFAGVPGIAGFPGTGGYVGVVVLLYGAGRTPEWLWNSTPTAFGIGTRHTKNGLPDRSIATVTSASSMGRVAEP